VAISSILSVGEFARYGHRAYDLGQLIFNNLDIVMPVRYLHSCVAGRLCTLRLLASYCLA